MVESRTIRIHRRVSIKWSTIGVYTGFILFSLIVLVPIYWLVRSSIANSTDLNKTPLIYFPTPTLQNFQTLIDQVPFFEYIRNSLIFAFGTTLVTLAVSYIAAYAFARIRFPGSS